jgi:hypothetical protein
MKCLAKGSLFCWVSKASYDLPRWTLPPFFFQLGALKSRLGSETNLRFQVPLGSLHFADHSISYFRWYLGSQNDLNANISSWHPEFPVLRVPGLNRCWVEDIPLTLPWLWRVPNKRSLWLRSCGMGRP